VVLGFAITGHCNLRCPHCIRDDVVRVQELEPELIERVLDDAIALWPGALRVSLTGGEPLIHRRFDDIITSIATRGLSYSFVSNAWHLKRIVPLLAKYPAAGIRLSLSGADEVVHDAERGTGSYRRVLMGVALLTRLRIPASLSIVIDRRTRHQIREAANLAESMGCARIHFILPQPVPGSVIRDTDLAPEEWWPVAREVRALAQEPGHATVIQLDYGAPFDGPEIPCDTFGLHRTYVDARGRLSTCCQLSEYGNNETDVVADLHDTTLALAWPTYVDRLREQQRISAPMSACARTEAASLPRRGSAAIELPVLASNVVTIAESDPFDALPCIRCARATGKMEWLEAYPNSTWHAARSRIPSHLDPVLA